MSDSTENKGIHTTTRDKETGWVNVAGDVVLSRHKTKEAAIKDGKRKAKRHGTRYTIHRMDGTVIATRNYALSPLD